MPLVAQITGAVALTALLTGPWWSRIPEATLRPTAVQQPVPFPSAVRQVPPRTDSPARPAHLNLEVRHTFGNVDLSIAVDGKPALETSLAGSGKRFKVFGKRAERGYTRTLDLAPGVHLVRVRVRSAADKFDQTRVERFDLESASVAALRISADKSGLSLLAERPSASARADSRELGRDGPAPVPTPAPAPTHAATLATARASQEANAAVELLQSVRSMLIAIAGFVASAATGFIVQEFLRRRKPLFAETEADNGKRRRAGFAG